MKSNKQNKVIYYDSRILRGSIASFILLTLAIYLSYMCNKGFSLVSMIYAICFSPYYVIYRLIYGIDKCFK